MHSEVYFTIDSSTFAQCWKTAKINIKLSYAYFGGFIHTFMFLSSPEVTGFISSLTCSVGQCVVDIHSSTSHWFSSPLHEAGLVVRMFACWIDSHPALNHYH